MKHLLLYLAFLGAVFVFVLTGCRVGADDSVDSVSPASTPTVHASSDIEAGRYLVLVGGCNDCHTVGFAETGGSVPDSMWLTGSPVGYRGPWGTSYAKNLRLTVDQLTEDEWVVRMRAGGLPPMPWPSVNALSESDTRAIYRFIASLKDVGAPAPAIVPPGEEPTTPYFEFVPQHLERLGVPGPPSVS